jgi:HAMP domain-containing protein
LPIVCATTLYLTLSRGAIIATAIAFVAYFLLGFSRATPGALLAIVPPCAVALARVYDLDVLVSTGYATPRGLAEGREAVRVVAIAIGVSVVLRALALFIDRAFARVPGPERLPRSAQVGVPLVLVAVVATVAVGLGAPGYVERQVDTFLSASSNDTDDIRDRLKVFNNNGRVEHWNVALDAWRSERIHGNGAGTFQNLWNRDRKSSFQVLDAHSLYLEVLGELGIVGLAVLLVALLAIVGGLIARLRGRDRPAVAAVLAAALAWLVHAGVDWDWELTSITIWLFGLSAIALAPATLTMRRPMPRLLRLVAALGCLLLALSPFAVWRSQHRLERAVSAFRAGDCRTTVDQALDSVEAVSSRAEPWELIAYCDVRLGQTALAVGAAEAAVRRDRGNWEYWYALALVRGAARKDPRTAAREAQRLNPLQAEPHDAVKAFDTARPALWERRARRLPLYLR